MKLSRDNKVTCVRKFWFCCGHRIVGHEGKCANVHGHNYSLFVHASADDLDSLGRIVDFSELKSKISSWIDECWDHSFILYEKDELLMPLISVLEVTKPFYIMDVNPTAENMALHLLNDVFPKLFKNSNITIDCVELWETENNKVVVQRRDVNHVFE